MDERTLGVLDTGSAGSSRFLELLVARLEKRHFLSAAVRMIKPSDDQACPTRMLEQLAEQCDVAVTGVCSAVQAADCAALDAVSFERALTQDPTPDDRLRRQGNESPHGGEVTCEC